MVSQGNECTSLIQGQSITNSYSCTSLSNKYNSSLSSPIKRKLIIATTIACMFFGIELIAGYVSNSLALMSDAFHLLSDVASFIVALIAIYLAEKPPTKKHTFGFHRAEVIAAVISVLTIWVLTGFLILEAVNRIQSPQVIDAKLMCVTASIGVLVNIILISVLGGHHSHAHSHDDEETEDSSQKTVHKKENINVRAAALHVLGDLLAAIGVLISSIVLIFKPEYTIVDPICTFIFSLIVLYTTFHLIKDSMIVLMEGVPGHIETEAIEHSLLQISDVVSVHDLHIWELSPGNSLLTAHIVIFEDVKCNNNILKESQQMIYSVYGILHSTLQIESNKAIFTNHCRPDICCKFTNH
ncbi:cation efflux family-domain-containing protein [Cokeromyces recurvatus]|uniref:cation efflux family-domain-containing protein n=1 Tax=Cokeromyces recurvatus TaxID=90255 RepID=UPI00221E67D3|nr:cation efflux family-domain-containing protein [Cokeromyces recurvatus]KAI7907110.1 cation efflux family-domain-containing protein [Cokeromyces recurvatus]